MEFRPRQLHPDRPFEFLPVRRDDTGRTGPTRRQLQRGEFTHLGRGWWLPGNAQDTTRQRILNASVLIPDKGAVTGWAALHWNGGTWWSGRTASGRPRPVPLLACAGRIRPSPEIQVSQEGFGPWDIEERNGLRVTTLLRSLVFEMRYATSPRAAAVLAGMAAYDDIVDRRELAQYLELWTARTGIPQARDGCALMKENWWSPQEAWTELTWSLDAGLPPLLCNVPVFDLAGRHVATPDLLDLEAGMAVEFEGAVHLDPARRRADVRREEAMRAAGLEVLTVMSGMHAHRAALADRMVRARQAALRRTQSSDRRAWTVVKPAWWVPTETVAQRRALEPWQRARFLRYRRGTPPGQIAG